MRTFRTQTEINILITSGITNKTRQIFFFTSFETENKQIHV